MREPAPWVATGAIFRHHVRLSGRVPQISVITGTSAGGGAYSPALTDFVVMTEGSRLFLTGPGVVEEVMGRSGDAWTSSAAPASTPRTASATWSPPTTARRRSSSEICSATCPRARRAGPLRLCPRSRSAAIPGTVVPDDPRKVYDVRAVIRCISDRSSMLELSPRWARNMVTALTRLNGRPVGVIANQPRYLGGVIDAAASEKASSFVARCDSFGLPLVVLVDTPGFLPGTKQEGIGVIRHGAGLLHAFSAARVPKVTVVLRKAYGGGFITMNSRQLGADLVMAWPGAEIGVLGAKQAVGIVHKRAIEASDDPEAHRDQLADAYAEEHLRADVAAGAGDVDEVIEPAATRERLVWAMSMLGGTERERRTP